MERICCEQCSATVPNSKAVTNYIPEMRAIVCDKCLADYDEFVLNEIMEQETPPDETDMGGYF